MTTVDSACPLCGARQRQGGPAGGFAASGGFPASDGVPTAGPIPAAGGYPAAGAPQPGYPAPPPGLPPPPPAAGYYQPGQPGGFGADPSGAYQGAAGYSGQGVGGYQPGPGPEYWQQQQQTYVPAPKTNVLAIVSLVAGILWFFWIGSVVALVCGLVALAQIKARNENGRGIAIAGLVLAGVGMATLVLIIILGIAVGHNSGVSPTGVPTGP